MPAAHSLRPSLFDDHCYGFFRIAIMFEQLSIHVFEHIHMFVFCQHVLRPLVSKAFAASTVTNSILVDALLAAPTVTRHSDRPGIERLTATNRLCTASRDISTRPDSSRASLIRQDATCAGSSRFHRVVLTHERLATASTH
jgi:hypothetical protein